jgi:hypothetical protein
MKNQWHRQLRREASAHHMCAENRSALENISDKGEAIALYKKTIDWALEEGYPCMETLRSEFSGCEAYGIFVDKVFHGERLDDQQVYVFHNCSGTIRTGLNVQKRIIPMLYFANGCNMDVKPISETAPKVRVPLYIFGPNRVNAEQSDNIECVTHKFEVK